MINVKRKYIVNNNSKITYKKGYICENKKGGSIKNKKLVKMIIKIMIIKIMIIKMMMIKNQINVNLKIVIEKPHIAN